MSKIEVENEEVEGETEETICFSRVVRNPGLKPDEDLMTEMLPGCKTVPENFQSAVKKFGDRNCYIWRRLEREHILRDFRNGREVVTKEFGSPQYLTYSQIGKMVSSLSSGIRRFDYDLEPGCKIGIYLDTCKEWMICAQAILRSSMVVVTAYANLGFSGLAHVINQCKLTVLVCSSSNLKNMDDVIHEQCPTLKKLITVGTARYKSKFFDVRNIYDILIDGEKHMYIPIPPKAEDLAVIMYTSGTTGDPKGVMMTHSNFVSTMGAMIDACDVNAEDTYISYLPLAHVMELVVHCAAMFTGTMIGIGTPRTLIAKEGGAKLIGDLCVIRPTILVGVPRVYDTIKKGVFAKIRKAGRLSRMIFNNVYGRKMWYLVNESKCVDVWGEGLVFSKIKDMVGGRLRLIISGGAPLSEDTHRFMQCVFGSKVKVIQGYGMTETMAGTLTQDVRLGTPVITGNAGFPLKCCEAKLQDVPKMKYFVKSDTPEGELMIRGPALTKGYYKLPEITKECYGEDGWFKTGDIARLNEDGSFSIIDRKKNLVKLSQGEYIAPESLEMIYSNTAFVKPNGICVIGDSLKSFIIAVVVIDSGYLREWAESIPELSGLNDAAVVSQPILKTEILRIFGEIAEKHNKRGFETIKDVVLTLDDWTPENGMLTASSKLKRRNIRKKYSTQIGLCYKSGGKQLTSLIRLPSAEDLESLFSVPKYFYQLNPDFYE